MNATMYATAAEAWELITARPELWLGASVIFEKGQRYEVPGASGVVRVVRPGDRLRLTWQPKGWAAPATVQLTLLKSGSGKTAGSRLAEPITASSSFPAGTVWPCSCTSRRGTRYIHCTGER